ncbi:MAG TPA: hypothetical protein VIY09_04715, partial [Rhizomicrobium sp.]
LLPPSLGHHAANIAAAHLGGSAHHGSATYGQPAAAFAHHADGSGYHSQLASLQGMQSDGLTDQFHLPAVEHFGT